MSMQDTGKMLYPSLTICEGTSGAQVYVDGKVYQSWDHYMNSIDGNINSQTAAPDFIEEFVGLSTFMPNMSMFSLKPSDIDDRDKSPERALKPLVKICSIII